MVRLRSAAARTVPVPVDRPIARRTVRSISLREDRTDKGSAGAGRASVRSGSDHSSVEMTTFHSFVGAVGGGWSTCDHPAGVRRPTLQRW
ncbi:hypothetical protein D1871_14325 [Nakamurella silvestris]|nr:hypothetical protein D1871_14325 [Nakamurella silvestris]